MIVFKDELAFQIYFASNIWNTGHHHIYLAIKEQKFSEEEYKITRLHGCVLMIIIIVIYKDDSMVQFNFPTIG